MFIGRYYHTIEEKNRLSLPKKFRDQNEAWVITRGLDGGLFLFQAKDFEQRLAELASRTFTKKRDRDFVRYLTNDASEVSCDQNGRVLVPEYLKEFGQLKKDVVVVGSYTYLEVWDVELYHQYLAKLEESGEQIAEGIDATSTP